jgi:hypothetical protein
MADTFTFTLDKETEKRLYDLMTDINVSKTPSFTIKDKHGNEAEYVKAVRCIDCQHWCEEDHVCGLRDCYGWDYKPDSFCSWAERRQK